MIIGGLVLAAFLLGAIVASYILRPHHDPTERPADRDYTDYPANQNAHHAAALIALAEEIQRQRKQAEATEYNKRYWEIITASGIWLYTLITIGIAVIAIYQARIFKETEKRQLRAYVGLNMMRVQCCKTPDDPQSKSDFIAIPFENDGQTPAYYLYSILSWMEYTKENEFPRDFECKANHALLEKEKNGGIVNPKKGFEPQFVIDDDIRPALLDSKGKEYWVIFCGRTIYRDIFGDTWSHQFCYQYKNPTLDGDIGFCPTGNEEVAIDAAAAPLTRPEPTPLPTIPSSRL